jgi:cob(I)alamin adenosyltransferase
VATVAAMASPASLVIINTGDGKGKSSSAWGVMIRSWARGWTVGVVQFIKSGDWKVGEEKTARHLGIEWNALGDGFTWDSTDMDATKARALHAWAVAKTKLASGDYDLLILDELTYLAAWGWVPATELAAAVRDRSPGTNVVITGRDAPRELIDVADTVTEMVKVKHAYDQGIVARKGIEY